MSFPPKTAAHIPVSVPQATVGCDICFEGPSHVAALAVESTLTTVQEGNRTIALVVNTTVGSLKLKTGVLLAQALAFDGQFMPTPIQLPSVSVGAVHDSSASTEKSSTASLDSLVKVVDYPEHRPSLLSLSNKYRSVIALPGEALRATSKAEHFIRLKSGAKPVYIPAYHIARGRLWMNRSTTCYNRESSSPQSRPGTHLYFWSLKRMASSDLSSIFGKSTR